jgi:hypothetical protein
MKVCVSDRYVGKFRTCCAYGKNGRCQNNPEGLEMRIISRFAFFPKKIGETKIWWKPYYEKQYFHRSYGHESCQWLPMQVSSDENTPENQWSQVN